MSKFADNFKKYMAPRLLEQHGEAVTFTPSGGTARSIMAIVESYGSQPLHREGGGEFITPKRIIRAINGGTSIADDGYGGIDADTLNQHGADRITLASGETLRLSAPPASYGPWKDAGMVALFAS